MTTELLDLGMIEPVEGSTPWVNPVVIVQKKQLVGNLPMCEHETGQSSKLSNTHS